MAASSALPFTATFGQRCVGKWAGVDHGERTKELASGSNKLAVIAVSQAFPAPCISAFPNNGACHGCISPRGTRFRCGSMTASSTSPQEPSSDNGICPTISDDECLNVEDKGEGMQPHPERFVGAVALIAGGTIGAGIIALPVKTVAAGFLPSTVGLTCCWAFMVLTSCYLIELSGWYGSGTNFVTIAERTLGTVGKWTTVALYCFIYCATLTAYIAEGAKLVAPLFAFAGVSIPGWLSCVAFTVVFSAFVYAGTEPSDKLNSACLAVAIVAYVFLVGIGVPGISVSLLVRADWLAACTPLPIMIVAFTFHNMVPSLLPYLGSQRLLLRAILVGSIIPLALYTLWQAVILGTIANAAALSSSEQITLGLRQAAGPLAMACVKVFSFFAIVTSFLGVALGCVDFISELVFSSHKSEAQESVARGFSMALMLAPAFIIAVLAPTAFLPALEYSGTFRLILFGIMPALMVWRGRYIQTVKQPPWVKGGKGVIALVMFVAIAIIALEMCTKVMRFVAM